MVTVDGVKLLLHGSSPIAVELSLFEGEIVSGVFWNKIGNL